MTLFDKVFSGNKGVANTLLDLFGTGMFVEHTVEGFYDPLTDTDTSRKTVFTITASPILHYSLFEKANSNIVDGDCKLLVKATDFDKISNLKDTITVDNVIYTIVETSPIYTGELVAMYKLRLRKQNG